MQHFVPVSRNLKNLFNSKRIHVQADGKYDMWAGTISFDDNLRVEKNTALIGTNGQLINIGSHSYLQSTLALDTQIGRYSSIAPGVSLMALDKPPIGRFSNSPLTYSDGQEMAIFIEYWEKFRREPYEPTHTPLMIGNDVWIGTEVLLKDGIRIGDGAVIKERAVLTTDAPAYAIMAGNPAQVIAYRFPDNVIDSLLQLRWWDYRYQSFATVNGNDSIEQFIDKVSNLKQAGQLELVEDEALTAYDILSSELIPD